MAEVAALLTIATGLASVAVKEACKRTFGMLKPYADGGIRSALLGGLKPQISSLADELQKMEAILRDAEKMNPAQRSKNDNDLVLQWLTSVKDAARFAEDVLDEILYEEIRVKVERRRRRSLRRKACNFISGSNGVVFGMKMSRKIRKITSMIAGFYREARDIGLKPVKLLRNDHQFSTQIMVMNEDLRDVRANVDASEIVGRQRDEELIVAELCQHGADRDFSVVAIVGMSGIGKTTLARRAYDNELVVKHFQERVWISVADKFDLKRLLNEMLESVTKTKSKLCNTDAIEKKLQGCLKEKRYLLVLDDVWSTGTEHWDSMRGSLRRIGGSVGSTVLVTARNNEVASVMKASLPHHLEELSDHDSWEMFKQRAFANKTHKKMSNLEAVGRRMLKRCHGVPLAIKTLACLLQSKNEEHEWQSIESSKVWDLQIGNKIMPSLLLSFYHLPSASLKRCFAYCSVILPKGSTLQACSLIEIWMAQGLLQYVGETDLPPEDIGREHMNILLSNGLLQAASYNIHGHVIECCMHDLMHDLALYVSKDTSLIVDEATGLDLPRTLVRFRKTAKLPELPRCLRVLILQCGLKEVPASIAGLRHLRYLDLSRNHFRSLPGSIGDLYMLQTLRLMCCDNLVQLPEQITDLVNLRHVYTSECVVLPQGMGSLTCLQTLPKINLKPESGWRIEELGSLPNVRNFLLLKGVEHIKSREEAKQAKLEFKEGIFELILIWNVEQATGDTGRDEDVMDGLKPHSNLRDLWVVNYNGKRFPPWLSDENILRNLKSMSFCNCKCDQLPELGCLPSLQSVEIDGMQSLKFIGTDGGKRIMFPQLKALKLKNMPNLEYWSEPVGSEAGFPCLEELEIKDCPKLSTASTGFSLLRKLTVRGIKSGQPLQMILSKGSKLTSLVSLTIQMVSELTSLPEGLSECTSLVDIKILSCESLNDLPVSLGRLHLLESFQVKHCRSLKSLPDFHGLSSLRKLTIVKCKALKQAPFGLDSCTSMKEMLLSGCSRLKLVPDLNPMGSHEMLHIYGFHQQEALPGWLSNLSRLRVLGIGKFCKDLESFPDISQLPRSLVDLDIKGGPKIKCLPSQLQFFTQLKCLGLFGFDGVETIPQWLGNLSSLEDLRIGKCRRLKSLPPLTVMERLVKLRRLEIKKCPLLEERCADCGGEEWHKIARIPHVIVNKKEIQKTS